jgi:hypothetical protein
MKNEKWGRGYRRQAEGGMTKGETRKWVKG